MTVTVNDLGQPIGFALPDWKPVPRPPQTTLTGQYCRIEPLDPDQHARKLFQAYQLASDDRMWTYLSVGPFQTSDDYLAWVRTVSPSTDPLFFAIVDRASGDPIGAAAYLRIDPNVGCIEIGHLAFSPRLQKSVMATEAIYLMMRQAFDLGYRRFEWKCDSLNAASRSAAERLGFQYEGLFRQATIYKGRSRDTTWYSIIDREWPVLNKAFQQWLDRSNFDAEGTQRTRLAEVIRKHRQHEEQRAGSGPAGVRLH